MSAAAIVRDAMRAYGLLGPDEVMTDAFYQGFRMEADEHSHPLEDYLAAHGLTGIQGRLDQTGRPVNPQKALVYEAFFREA